MGGQLRSQQQQHHPSRRSAIFAEHLLAIYGMAGYSVIKPMKRLLVILLLCGSAFATTAVTGHMSTLGGTVPNGTYVRFWLRGCGGNQPRVGSIAVIAPTQGGVFFFDFPANASGDISGTLYSTRDLAGTGDGEIECGGSHTATWYGMQFFYAGKGGPETPISAKNTDTFDISTVTPITTNPVVTAPSGDTTYARLDGGNQPFTGNVTPSGNGTLNLGGTSNRWNGFFNTLNVSGGATLAGTFAGGTFTGSTLTSPTINTPTITNPTITGGGTLSGSFTLSNAGTFTNTQMNEYLSSILNSCSAATEFGVAQALNSSTDAVMGCVAVPGTSTVHQQNAVAGYANTSQTGGSGGAVGGYFQGRILTNNSASAWGINPLVQDVVSDTNGQMIGQETDINVLGSPARVWGILITGATTGTIPSSGSAAGLEIRAPSYAGGSSIHWPDAIYLRDGAAVTGINIQGTSGSNNVSSMTLSFTGRDSGGTQHSVSMSASPAGVLTVNSNPFRLGNVVAFSALASCAAGLEGTMNPVNDSSTNVWGATITGGGANHVLAYCDGTNWTVAAK